MKQLTITEWFARAVAAGLMPKWENVHAKWVWQFQHWLIINSDNMFESFTIPETSVPRSLTKYKCQEIETVIQLRKDGKDLYSLEWRKANDWESYKFFKVWYKQGTEIVLTTFTFEMLKEKCYCLLADYDQIAPTEQDFKRIYGE